MRTPAILQVSLAAGVAVALSVGVAGLGQTPAAQPKPGYRVPRTAWGQPDIHGDYTNKDEANTPLERPQQLAGKDASTFTEADLARLAAERAAAANQIAGGIGGAETGAGPTHWYDHLSAKGSRPWFILDPPDGRLPAMTPQAQRREAAVALLNNARNGEGRADSTDDRSMYDRCITRGLPGSMMPAIYGNAYEIVQAPDTIAIRYEMIHETRLIPLDGRPHVGAGVRELMGDARGRFDGDTLVVETTNLNNKTGTGGGYFSDAAVLTEKFRRIAKDELTYDLTVNDPKTWTAPFTIHMPYKEDPSYKIYEYACHEGNYMMIDALTGARELEKVGANVKVDSDNFVRKVGEAPKK
jgi:hypothetical protein